MKFHIAVLLSVAWSCVAAAAGPTNSEVASALEADKPHTPTLIFYLTGADGSKDADALRASVQKLETARLLDVNTNRSYVRIRFDNHVVSYHQVAQALSDAGKSLGKNYNPCITFFVKEYAQTNNAAKVNAILAGKRLNTRVSITTYDKAGGLFVLHFLPLTLDPKITGPQGFNGGHLHHPISDPPPRGLGLTSGYASEDNLTGRTAAPF